MSLSGKTVAITRPAQEVAEFVKAIESLGGTAVPLNTIEVLANSDTTGSEFLSSLKGFDPDYSAFLSSKSVKTLFEAAKKESIYDEMLSAVMNTAVVAVGPKTREALAEFGIRVAHMPDNYSSIGLGEMFTSLGAVGKKIIMPRSEASKSFLRELLEKIGLEVLEVRTYGVRAASDTSEWGGFVKKFSDGGIDCVAFTSASSVRAFFEIMNSKGFSEEFVRRRLAGVSVFTIGEQAGGECKNARVDGVHVSDVHTIEGMADKIIECLGG